MLRNTYGLEWPANMTDVGVEMAMIRSGGFRTYGGKAYGAGLFHHYRTLQTLLWPEDDHHRWSDLILKTILEERIVAITGSRDSGKTRTVSKWALCDYWCHPENTLIIMTSTDNRGLELRVFGDIKSLFQRAKDRYPWLAGNVVDAKHGIFTDSIGEDGEVRDMRKGIIGVPCIGSQGEFLGQSLRNFAGIKQQRRRLIGDELQYILTDYLKVLDAMDKGDFKFAGLGNPIAENGKALDRVSEPKNGWGSQGEVTKTATWPNKYNGVTINLVGTDSPNFDAATANRYPYLMNQKDADTVSARPGGKDSIEWWSLVMGVRKVGAVINRVLTVEMIETNGGFGPVIWTGGKPLMKIYGVDAGFGGDECVRTFIECGEEVGGQNVILFGEQKVIPVLLSSPVSPEDQIALFAKADCAGLGVPDENVYIEAGMRATLAISFARIMSPAINAINFGGPATQRPVSNDVFIYDEKQHARRLKTCYEHYSKFVTELAFSVRAVVESRQARGFPRQAAEEFGRREWRYVYNDRYELETKQEYKVRNGGVSPNYSDSAMIAVEGARRLGFVIERLRDPNAPAEADDWLSAELDKYRRTVKKTELNYK
jgi:hypothetical protein